MQTALENNIKEQNSLDQAQLDLDVVDNLLAQVDNSGEFFKIADGETVTVTLDLKSENTGYKTTINTKEGDGWFSYALNNWDKDLDRPKNPLPWNREKILMLLRHAYRKLGKTIGLAFYFDPYTILVLCGALDVRQYEYDDDGYEYEYTDITQILKMLNKDVFPQMEKPLCWSCAGEGICHLCDGELSQPPVGNKK